MTTNFSLLSPALRELVMKDGKLDRTELVKIAENVEGKYEAALAAEAEVFLQSELSGNKAFGDIGDGTQYIKEPTDDELQAGEPKRGFFRRAGKYISDWWTDRDKVSKDGKDDGYISTGEKAESFLKV